MSNIQAVILAGGKGSRLRPYTTVLPKPLVPLGDMPIAEIIIRQLKKSGITRIAISTGHLAELMRAYFGDGKKWGVQISYVYEDKPLGTAGALKLIKSIAPSFLVINGDTLTNLSFKQLLAKHKEHNKMATITIKQRVVKTDFGVIQFDRRGLLKNYIEKPEHKSYVSLGINVFKRKALEYIKKNESLGMPEFMLRIKEKGNNVYCFKTTCDWFDLGRVEDLQRGQDYWEANKSRFI
ncbi:MAG: NTP transferase domain-containing protein [Candidatus Omnitrophica bacterium]|nr:NTP transferase domain-containing protein [Candidatus Omnitrophota bacterium]